ncbi:MAG: hypothetical protein HY805_06040 [Nitrospirae bacterium]|nr:hypothetical protein [Nitrospirota bacterium]
MAVKLGQLLLNSNIITQEQLNQALNIQKKDGGRLGTNLVKLGYVTEEKLVTFLSKQFGVPAINLSNYKIDPAVLKLIPAYECHYRVLWRQRCGCHYHKGISYRIITDTRGKGLYF